MEFMYVIIIFLATLIGAVCGMGGGVIIKPLLDAASNFTTFQIGVISGSCVLAMSIASLLKHYLAKTKVDAKTAVYLSIGSVIGGFIGDYLFGIVETRAALRYNESADAGIKVVQNIFLLIMILTVLLYMLFLQKKGIHLNLKNPVLIVAVGGLLGAVSVFLDIGGGPINVCAFVFLFGMDVKLAGVSSLITILFAQITKFVKYFTASAFIKNIFFDKSLSIISFTLLVICAVAGGLTGAIINKKFSGKFIKGVYCGALLFVMLLSIYNIIRNVAII